MQGAFSHPPQLRVVAGELHPELNPKVRIRLSTERMLVCRETDLGAQSDEVSVPTIDLCFEYAGVRIRASDPRERLFVSVAGGLSPIERDVAYERKAKHLLESFGAVEIGCLHTHEPAFDSQADYLVQGEDNVHAYCTFSSYAVPQLRKLGFELEIAADYPFQTLSEEISWYGALSPALSHSARTASSESIPDWFDLELGVEIAGARVNLLGALLELVDSAPRSASLGRLLQSTRTVALPIAEHQYLAVPREQLALILDVLRDLYLGAQRDAYQHPPALRREQCVDLARLAAALSQQKGQKAPARFQSALVDTGAALLEAPEPAPQPTTLNAELRPYQAAGLAWLQKLRASGLCGVLADDMGLGKTLQTIAHITCEKQAGRLSAPVLIVAPTSLVGGWSKELQRFSPGLSVRVIHGPKRRHAYKRMSEADVVITTYPLLLRDLDQFEKQPFHLLVLDEAQAIKNPRSHVHRAACSLQATHRLCLTGTPIENNLGELWALFNFLMPNFLGSAESFRTHFRVPVEREGNAERLAALRARVTPFILRRMKDRVATELPAKTELVLPVELEGAQRDLYESIRVAAHADVRAAIRKKGLLGSTVTILDALMKLRQVCCDPRLVRVKAAAQVTQSAKYEQLLQLLQGQISQGHRILVFSQFTSMLDLIAAGVRELGTEPLILTGATQNRQRLIERFEAGDSEVFLISLKAGGTGLNLTSADTVIHYDPWWNPAAQAQATDRAHRIGQTKPVFVHNLIVAGSVEERMLKLQQRKRDLAQSLLGESASAAPLLSEQQVHHLFAPLPRPL